MRLGRLHGTALGMLMLLVASSRCGDLPDTYDPGGDVGEVSAATAGYAAAYCRLLERCAPEFGRRWTDEATCLRYKTHELAGPAYEIWNPDATEAEIQACADYLEVAACVDFYEDAEFRWTPPCDALFDPPGASAATVAPSRRSASTGTCLECEPGSSCVRRPELGPVCLICIPDAQLGESCLEANCAEGLVCDRGVSDTCVDVEGFACTGDWQCDAHTHYCDPDLGCQGHMIGTPCDRQFLSEAETGEELVCIGGSAAQPSPAGWPCEDSLDCESPGLTCDEGTCQPRAGRGEACKPETLASDLCGPMGMDGECAWESEDGAASLGSLGGLASGGVSGSSGALGGLGGLLESSCQGDLACRDGVCDDRPGEGEPCPGLGRCQLPLVCLEGVCQRPVEGPAELGEVCGALGVLGPRATACTDGYCDPSSGRCARYLDVGEPCDSGLLGFLSCGPDAYCDLSGDAGRCAAYVPIGGSCAAARCDPEISFCSPDLLCQPRRPVGAPCDDALQCQDAECLGICAGGPLDGLPCTAASQCQEGGACVGTCRGDREGWSACANPPSSSR